jgi:SAM-dependent methyltransferase
MKNVIKNILPGKLLRIIKGNYLTIRGLYYYGHKFKCPVCNHSFRKMLPGGFDLKVIQEKEIIGAGLRDNNICPYCLSTDRDRLVFEYLKYQTEIYSQKLKILHVSPEPSLYNRIKKLKNIIYITGTKYSEGIYYHKNIESIDLTQLQYGDEEFDMIICNHVLEHIIDDTKAISEIFRVIVPGGVAILQVPISLKLDKTYENALITSRKEREIHFGQFDHVRIYGKDYKNKLENAGFEVQIYDPFKEENLVNKENVFALNVKEKLYIGHKLK